MIGGSLGVVAMVLIGALVAISGHQLALGRADRTYYVAALWSLWSGAVVAVHLIVHLAHTDAGTIMASRALYATIAAGLPVGLTLARSLFQGDVDPRVMRRWYALSGLIALGPLALHVVLPEQIVWFDDLLGGRTRLATVGPAGGVVLLVAAPVVLQMGRWLFAGPATRRIRAARMMVPIFVVAVTNDVLVLAAGLPSTLLFPFVATLQAFVLHGLLISESAQAFRDLEAAVGTRTGELEAQRGELRRAIDNLRTVMSGLPDAVIAVTADKIMFANAAAARMIGVAPEALIGASLVAQLGTDRISGLCAEALATEQRVGPLELQLAGGGPETRALEVDGLGIEFAGLPSVLVILRDVSERSQMREQLLRSDRLASLGTLVAGVAHEINNPLSYVLGNLEFAIEGIAADEGAVIPLPRAAELREALAEASEGGHRIRYIVEGMRTFARPEVADVTDVDLRDVVADALKLTRHTVEHQARLELELGAVPSTRANRARLGQIAVNLIMNAVQVPRQAGQPAELKIVTRTDALGEARLEIHDNGVGMSREVLSHAFDPFFTTKKVGSGTGLGLSICHGIATALGGRVELESVEGEGTIASLVMPARTRAESPTFAPLPPTVTTRKARVLIVDDEPGVAIAMRRILKGHEVLVAEDLGQLEISLGGGPFDLVLCDLMMPGLTGMELYERLARDAPQIAARMTFMTGGAFTADAMAFMERMAERCVLKPISAATLRALVDQALDRSPGTSPSI